MKLIFVEIQNFRKLKSCKIEFSEKETVFVGANNSGKTSAMDALRLFLTNSTSGFKTTDFTLTNWNNINEFVIDSTNSEEPKISFDNTLDDWVPYLPAMDVWLNVENHEIGYVSRIIPSLDWEGGLLGIKLRLEPKKLEELLKNFKNKFDHIQKTLKSENGATDNKDTLKRKLKLWPIDIRDYLDKKLKDEFQIRAYLLDPTNISYCENNHSESHKAPIMSEAIEGDPFKGLIKIDYIRAQRGFSDQNDDTENASLSSQLKNYFEKHLNPSKFPEHSDLDALESIDKARVDFDLKLENSFKKAIKELESLNYPSFSDPKIKLSCQVKPVDGLNHPTAVQFSLTQDGEILDLPEKYNGLGYQNLISIVFKLISFRDDWLRVGKVSKDENKLNSFIEPLHIVLLEEPEAHLHAQVQQVFIKRAYDLLTTQEKLEEDDKYYTQLIVSTHSSHIAHEIDFNSLRYFLRKPAPSRSEVPTAVVKNLSEIFSSGDETSRFAKKYLQTTHCDIFFADAVIIIEGASERILIPHFIRNQYKDLNRCYISILEIGGSHAHKLKQLLIALELHTLIITDIDARDDVGKVQPKVGNNYKTLNNTLRKWIPCEDDIDKLLSDDIVKILNNKIKVAYQSKTEMSPGEIVIPSTFEDALALNNEELFNNLIEPTGLMKKFSESFKEDSWQKRCKSMFDALKDGKKAEFALELLFINEPDKIKPPIYIQEGLNWLKNELSSYGRDFEK